MTRIVDLFRLAAGGNAAGAAGGLSQSLSATRIDRGTVALAPGRGALVQSRQPG